MKHWLVIFLGLVLPGFAQSEILINGAGATFPFPLYSKWFSEYNKKFPEVKINYQSIGSGGGISQLQKKTVDFGASDAFMTAEELSRNPEPIIHMPTVLGAVVVTYNLKQVSKPLRLSREAMVGIFSGQISYWDDAKIQSANPGVALPHEAMILVTRADGSGTTAVFTDYLAKLDPAFEKNIGRGKVARWPSGVSGKGNEGVTGLVQQNPGAIGYVELVYAKENKLTTALVQNAAGQFVEPSVKAITEAAASVKSVPADFNLSVTNATGKTAYPICAFTYILMYQSMPEKKGRDLVKFMEWAYGPGQKMAEGLSYAPLPPQVLKAAQSQLKRFTFR